MKSIPLLIFLSLVSTPLFLLAQRSQKDIPQNEPEEQIIWTMDALEWTPLRPSQKKYYIHRVGALLKTVFPMESWPQKRIENEMKSPQSLTDLKIKIDQECNSNKDATTQKACDEIKNLRIKSLRKGVLRP
jgi:hypothetical protein